jgi:parallel beta-helix repeat protein
LLVALLAGVAVSAAAVAILVDGSPSSPEPPGSGATTIPTRSAPPSGRSAPPSGPHHYVTPRGSDSNPGTRDAPWRTIAKALSAARPGDTVVFRSGTYGARDTITTAERSGTARAPITFRGAPGGPTPVILGHLKITGSYLRFSGFLFDGPTGQVKEISSDNPKGEEVEIAIEGDHDTISHSEIRGSDWHAGIFLSDADEVSIVGNYIHDNGDTDPCCFKLQANASHGIYFDSGSGVIANNVIENNVARGVQLYPAPADVLVAYNTIVGNGRAGVIVSNDAANNTIANNIVADNGDTGVRSDSLTGSGNLVINNLVWHNAHGNLGPMAEGLTLVDNIEAAPRLVSPTSYRLRSGSPAIDAADPTYAVSEDYDGVRRPQGDAPDIGAFETH